MKCGLDHGKFGDIIIDSENIVKSAVIVMDVGGATFKNLAVGSFHHDFGNTVPMLTVSDH